MNLAFELAQGRALRGPFKLSESKNDGLCHTRSSHPLCPLERIGWHVYGDLSDMGSHAHKIEIWQKMVKMLVGAQGLFGSKHPGQERREQEVEREDRRAAPHHRRRGSATHRSGAPLCSQPH